MARILLTLLVLLTITGCENDDGDHYFVYAIFSRDNDANSFYLARIDRDDLQRNLTAGDGRSGGDGFLLVTGGGFENTIFRVPIDHIALDRKGFFKIVGPWAQLDTASIKNVEISWASETTYIKLVDQVFWTESMVSNQNISIQDSTATEYFGDFRLSWLQADVGYSGIYRLVVYQPDLAADSLVYYTFDTTAALRVKIPKQGSVETRVSLMAASYPMVKTYLIEIDAAIDGTAEAVAFADELKSKSRFDRRFLATKSRNPKKTSFSYTGVYGSFSRTLKSFQLTAIR